ncbi:MAG: hypothetical protein EAZ55_02930 [Cytophagales bacterium]|nr:MAG: hypothetical protein EAZ55_02930 [Cytophagales bacterium]
MLLLVWLVSSCDMETKFERKTAKNGLFSLEIADYLKEASELNKTASLQYSNEQKEVYIIVIDDSKKEIGDSYDLKSYFEFASGNIKGGIKDAKLSTPTTKDVNGMKLMVGEITGSFNDIGVYYILATVESKDNFYQVLTWTMEKNKDSFGKDMMKMVESIKEEKK